MATVCPSCGARNLEGVDECANCGAALSTLDVPKPASAMEQAVMSLPVTAMGFSKAVNVSPDDTLEQAVQLMRKQDLKLVQVMENERLVGVLSVRDILKRVGADYQKQLTRKVRDFMTERPVTLPPEAPITYVLHEMDVGGYRHVPIVQDDSTVGMVSTRDVVRYIVKSTARN